MCCCACAGKPPPYYKRVFVVSARFPSGPACGRLDPAPTLGSLHPLQFLFIPLQLSSPILPTLIQPSAILQGEYSWRTGPGQKHTPASIVPLASAFCQTVLSFGSPFCLFWCVALSPAFRLASLELLCLSP